MGDDVIKRVGTTLLGLLVSLAPATVSPEPRQAPRGASRDRSDATQALLAAVRRWGCQFVHVRPSVVAASALDMIVVDPGDNVETGKPMTAVDVARMQTKPDGGRRLVLAYLSVGEAAEYRPYWQRAWATTPPPWLGQANPEWPQAHLVRYWMAEWRKHLFEAPVSGLDSIRKTGFDGVFLDRVDAYQQWTTEHPGAAEDMVALVASLASHAREADPGFLVVGQNSEELLADQLYRAAISAVSKESLLYGRNGQGTPNTEEQVSWSLRFLSQARRDGKPVLVIEYLDDPAGTADARSRLARWGFQPFFATRVLDRLPN